MTATSITSNARDFGCELRPYQPFPAPTAATLLERAMTQAKYKISESSYQFPMINAELKKARSCNITIADGFDIRLSFIHGGVFCMGSGENEPLSRSNERPSHAVSVKDFWIGTTPLTNREWRLVMDEALGGDKPANFPVVDVWLENAFAFCRRLSENSGLKFRLPTETEWEYSCRAGTSSPFAFGDTITKEIVNHDEQTGPWEVMASGVANNFGLYDMHGCVWEWCSDVWHPNYIGAPTDGSSWRLAGDASYVVQRGGAWNSNARSCRSACRVGDIARNSDGIVGLRIALDG